MFLSFQAGRTLYARTIAVMVTSTTRYEIDMTTTSRSDDCDVTSGGDRGGPG
jgi:hypothetical protein